MLFLMFVQSLFQFGAKVGKWEGYYGEKNYLDMFFLVSSIKVIDTVGFLAFFLKFYSNKH